MAGTKVVTEPKADPKKGRRVQRSGTRAPYCDLARSIEVARAIHDDGGGVCTRNQLAPMLHYKSARSGTFLNRVGAAKMFGLVDQRGGELRVTARGQAIVAPVHDNAVAKAKLDAFLAVELFRKVFDKYDGTTLPAAVGLENLLGADYGIIEGRRAPTVRILMSSAEQAGLFNSADGRSRMVKPVGLNEGHDPPPDDPLGGDGRKDSNGGGGRSGGGGPEAGHIDPAIIGLLRRLPPGGTPLGTQKREKLISAFTSVVAFIYPDPGDDDDS